MYPRRVMGMQIDPRQQDEYYYETSATTVQAPTRDTIHGDVQSPTRYIDRRSCRYRYEQQQTML